LVFLCFFRSYIKLFLNKNSQKSHIFKFPIIWWHQNIDFLCIFHFLVPSYNGEFDKKNLKKPIFWHFWDILVPSYNGEFENMWFLRILVQKQLDIWPKKTNILTFWSYFELFWSYFELFWSYFELFWSYFDYILVYIKLYI